MARKSVSVAKKIALIGIMTASIECVKLVLAPIPNVEAVTLLTALYGYVFGYLGIIASALFVMIEPLIWGFNLWVVSYFLYWPALAALFMLIRKLDIKSPIRLTVISTMAALISTAWFGVLTSLVDVGLFTGYYEDFFLRFSVYYARGISFYLAEIITNAVLFPLLFVILSRTLMRIKRKMLTKP